MLPSVPEQRRDSLEAFSETGFGKQYERALYSDSTLLNLRDFQAALLPARHQRVNLSQTPCGDLLHLLTNSKVDSYTRRLTRSRSTPICVRTLVATDVANLRETAQTSRMNLILANEPLFAYEERINRLQDTSIPDCNPWFASAITYYGKLHSTDYSMHR